MPARKLSARLLLLPLVTFGTAVGCQTSRCETCRNLPSYTVEEMANGNAGPATEFTPAPAPAPAVDPTSTPDIRRNADGRPPSPERLAVPPSPENRRAEIPAQNRAWTAQHPGSGFRNSTFHARSPHALDKPSVFERIGSGLRRMTSNRRRRNRRVTPEFSPQPDPNFQSPSPAGPSLENQEFANRGNGPISSVAVPFNDSSALPLPTKYTEPPRQAAPSAPGIENWPHMLDERREPIGDQPHRNLGNDGRVTYLIPNEGRRQIQFQPAIRGREFTTSKDTSRFRTVSSPVISRESPDGRAFGDAERSGAVAPMSRPYLSYRYGDLPAAASNIR